MRFSECGGTFDVAHILLHNVCANRATRERLRLRLDAEKALSVEHLHTHFWGQTLHP